MFARVSVLLMLLCVLLVSCQSQMVSEVEALSSRPQTWTKFVGLVRLKGEPLAATLIRDDEGHDIVDTQHKQALLGRVDNSPRSLVCQVFLP